MLRLVGAAHGAAVDVPDVRQNVDNGRRGGAKETRVIRLGRRPWWLEVVFEPRDCWVGVLWMRMPCSYGTAYGQVTHEWHVYLCLVPCLPVHLVIAGTRPCGAERTKEDKARG